MNKNVIFYFSGTGNSLKVARDIAKALGNCDIFSMPSFIEHIIPSGYERIGFVFPVYAAGLPNCVEKFIIEKDFKLCKDSYTFAIATYGGSSGNSINRINELLKDKGITLNAGHSVKMFANYVALYDMAKDSNIVHKNSQQPINVIAEKIKNKENMALSIKSNKLLHYFNKLVAKGFYKKDMGYNVSEYCSSCGVCSMVCPVKNIEISQDKPKFNHKCEQCMACIQVCPKHALNYKNKTQKRGRYINPDIIIEDLINHSTNNTV